MDDVRNASAAGWLYGQNGAERLMRNSSMQGGDG